MTVRSAPLVAVVVAAGLSACAAGVSVTPSEHPTAPGEPSSTQVDATPMTATGRVPRTGPSHAVSIATAYRSLSALSKGVTDVVVVDALAQRTTVPADGSGSGPETATVASVRVVEVLNGSTKPGRILAVREPGGASGGRSEDGWSTVRAGQRYVLFLNRFEFRGGHPLGQWTPFGEYVHGPGQTWHRAGGYPSLPLAATDSTLRRSVRPAAVRAR